ncbi:MAG: dihydrodipicolinate reductase C-terminal domain-containing protein [Actinomycetota bacterium]|jgi:4-hydroxy-tetrahydrodipicolinate reductase|nr:dihydrodipicolinate reductase C-terminal domain-containing protein [Actinomycetota bacterium]
MRIGLFGFGKTGRHVARSILASEENSLEWVVRKSDHVARGPLSRALERDDSGLERIFSSSSMPIEVLFDNFPVDAIIDFSSPQGVHYYGDAAAARGVRIVTAISNYSCDEQEKLRKLSTETAVLWSPNITVGVNLLILAANLLQLIAPHADVEIVEEHFRAKKGVSSTAKIIAKSLGVGECEVKSLRAGGIVGTHEVVFGFASQTVRLRHESVSAEAFGEGALFAAQQMASLPHGFYTMEDLLIPAFIENARKLQPRVLAVNS